MLADTFESLEEGDRVELPEHYANPMTVSFVGDAGWFVGVKDDRGNERELVQNKHDRDAISLMVGSRCKGYVNEIRVVDGGN